MTVDFDLAVAAALSSSGDRTRAKEIATFGQDLFCIDEIRSGRLARGRMRLAQSAYHRLITPRGTLAGGDDDQEFGTDILVTIGEVDDARGPLPGLIQSELTKDPQILTVVTDVERSVESNGDVSYDISITCTTAIGPFELVLAASEDVAKLIKINLPES